ncbi:MAG TPA: kelch repeat-containing protein [Solirubrobacteraceae bacterium]|nr:kelch repeat-containing protein [Solirubrobacteraceae bacterium]
MSISARVAAHRASAVALALALGACGGSSSKKGTASLTHAGTQPLAAARPVAGLRVTGTTALPAAVQLPAVTADGRGVLAVGGLDAADASVASIVLIGGSGTRIIGQLPLALHDIGATEIEGQAFTFGGGEPGGASDAIFRIGASGAQLTGRLPAASSDLSAATIDHTAYVVGGYTVSAPLRTIVAFTPGGHAHVVATMPRPLRYASVAAVGGRMLIAGGTSGETAQRAILSFDPASGVVRQIGELPRALTHAAGAALNGWFYVLGGRGEGLSDQTSAMLAIDPLSGAVHRAGTLPEALSDIGAATLGGHIIAVGGRNRAGTVSDRALTLAPVSR